MSSCNQVNRIVSRSFFFSSSSVGREKKRGSEVSRLQTIPCSEAGVVYLPRHQGAQPDYRRVNNVELKSLLQESEWDVGCVGEIQTLLE